MKIICLVWVFSWAVLLAMVKEELDARDYAKVFRMALITAVLAGLILF